MLGATQAGQMDSAAARYCWPPRLVASSASVAPVGPDVSQATHFAALNICQATSWASTDVAEPSSRAACEDRLKRVLQSRRHAGMLYFEGIQPAPYACHSCNQDAAMHTKACPIAQTL